MTLKKSRSLWKQQIVILWSISNVVRRGLLLLVVVLLMMQVIACREESTRISSISQIELIEKMRVEQPLLILDVRTPKEYDAGHIPGARNIDFKELKKRMAEIESWKKTDVVVYCERGIRAKIAEATLVQAGFGSIYHLEGHISRWRKNALPLNSNRTSKKTNEALLYKQ